MRNLKIFCQALAFVVAGSFNGNAQSALYPNTFSLADVKLLDGPFKHAQDLNVQTLLKYDVDRLLAGFRKEAGLPPKAKSFANWDGLDGHVGGHYISALAMNCASSDNAECKRRLEYMLAELKDCQDANTARYPEWAKGYIGAVPNGAAIWGNLQKGDFAAYRAAWVPWYNVHKTFAGLRDGWLYAGNEKAKSMFLAYCDWAINITSKLSDTQMQAMLDTEHGGMNEVLADAYQITGNNKYLLAAKRFSHQMLLNPMSAAKDNLDNKHANTQVPKAVGFQRIGELGNDKTYFNAGNFFWETVTTNRTLAFGGNSRREFFPAATAANDFISDVEGPESCNSYNMLKLTEGLFRMNASAKLADYYERTLYNHILSTQHPVHGGYVYFTPVRPRHYRVYSAPNEAMWCCVGSGMENHGKYSEFIFTHQHDSLYVNLFIASELNWKEKGIKLKQLTQFPSDEQTRLQVTGGSSRFTMMLRYPSWVKEGALKITVNGKAVSYKMHPSSYVAVNRLWKKGDEIVVHLPMENSIEHLPGVPEYVALMHGPLVLGAKTGTGKMNGLVADGSRWGHIASGEKLPVYKAPILVSDSISKLAGKLTPVKNKPLNFTFTNLKMINAEPLVLEPFYKIHDARYMMYWMALNNNQYSAYLDSVTVLENQKLLLQKRTVDFVAPGEQQPEADHQVKSRLSNTGNNLDEFWRDARNEGFFSYKLATNNEASLNLVVRYWGAEPGNRKFNIYIDDSVLVQVDNTAKWNTRKFQEVEYPIPDAMIKGKQNVTVKFQAQPGSTAGPVYYIRLVKKEGSK